MAISKAEKAAYNDEIKDIKKKIEGYMQEYKEAVVKKKKIPNITGYYCLEIAKIQLDITESYLEMNRLSLEMLNIKNESSLNNARKEFYKILQEIEEIIGKNIDGSLKENDEYLSKIDRLSPKQILVFIKRVHDIFKRLWNDVGEGSKWKWSFVELQARVAIITKNITKFSDIAKFRDPRGEFFYDRRDLMRLCKDSLAESAKQYRTKYELSGKAREDLKRSIDLLSVLRKIHVLFGEDGEASKLKTTIDAQKQALKAGDKKKDSEKMKKK